MEINNQVKINGKIYDVLGNIMSDIKYMRGCRRDVIRLDFNLKEDEFNAIGIKDNIKWSIIENHIFDNGKKESNEYDKSAYSLACDKVIHFDGTVSIYLGKPTEIEILKAKYENMEKEIIKLSKKGLITSKDLKEIIK